MTNERLQALKIRVAQADALATDIELLEVNKHECDANKLTYVLQCEVYRLGREALLRIKEVQLESLLTEPEPESSPVEVPQESLPPPSLEMGTQLA